MKKKYEITQDKSLNTIFEVVFVLFTVETGKIMRKSSYLQLVLKEIS